MKKRNSKIIRLVISIGICVMFMAILLPTAIGTPINTQNNSTIKEINPILLRILASYKFINWNFWSNPPHIFSQNDGNVGIGTNNPLAKLDVFGNIAVNGQEIIDTSGNWVGNTTGPWGLNGNDTYYTDGNVGIGTTTPAEKLDVNGSINALPVVGKWAMNSIQNGAGYFLWETQLFDTNPQYLESGIQYITIKIAGYYQINVNVVQQLVTGTQGIVSLQKNGIVITGSWSYTSSPDVLSHHFSDVAYFNAGDTVSVYSQTANANRYGGYQWTTLSIIRLN
jgi:hypothetical protein